jgi:protein TonB
LAQDLGLTEGMKRISVQFIIDKNGMVTNIKARAPHPRLQKEAIRIIKLLPKMSPGRQRNKAVNVRYNLPIGFRVIKS